MQTPILRFRVKEKFLVHDLLFFKAKRYVYIILLIEKQMAKVYDDLILMFTRRMYSLKNNAKAASEIIFSSKVLSTL